MTVVWDKSLSRKFYTTVTPPLGACTFKLVALRNYRKPIYFAGSPKRRGDKPTMMLIDGSGRRILQEIEDLAEACTECLRLPGPL